MVSGHKDQDQSRKVKHVRRTILSGLSRTTQRLTPVTPNMIKEADIKETDSANKHSPPDIYRDSYLETSISSDLANSPVKQQFVHDVEEGEQLEDDITVVIPSGVPLGKDENRESTHSNVSDTSWVDNASDSDSSLNNNGVVSAPWKSIMAYKQQLKSRRKAILPQRIHSPVTALEHPELIPEKTSEICAASEVTIPPALSVPSVMATSTLISGMISPLMIPNVSSEQSISTNDPSLTLGRNPLYLRNPVLNSGILGPQLALLAGVSSPNLHPGTAAHAASVNMEALSRSSLGFGLSCTAAATWTSSTTSTTESNSPLSSYETQREPSLLAFRNSSLSRSHSRRGRLNMVRTPVRREDACKPTLLPDGRTVYRCTYCNKDFGSFSDINRHMDFHEDIRPYKCQFCDYYARTNSQLKVHMMRHQGIREFHCKLCNYKGVTQSDLNRHMKSQIHMMKAQNECRLCGEGFVSPKNLEKHLCLCQGPQVDSADHMK
jgi:hypothetical protein